MEAKHQHILGNAEKSSSFTSGSEFEAEGGDTRKAPEFKLSASHGFGGAPIQKKAPDGYGTEKENQWVADKAERTGSLLVYGTKAEAEERMKYLRTLGQWENFKVAADKQGKFHVEMQGKRTVSNFILLVKKAEAAYPLLGMAEIMDRLRALAPGYNTDRFRVLLGKQKMAEPLKPVKDKLSTEDIAALRAMIEHGGETTPQGEKGIAKDIGGNSVAMGHVLTGLTAGMNRDKDKDVTIGGWEALGGAVGVGENVDNLFASTIAGDLGQSAALLNKAGDTSKDTKFIGKGTESMVSEMIGDIDGFNLGNAQSGKKSKGPQQLSSLLAAYYASVNKDEAGARYGTFEKGANEDLKDQTVRFASNYVHGKNVDGIVGGSFSEISTECNWAVDQFQAWVAGKKAKPTKAPTSGIGDGYLHGPSNEIFLVGNPSQYKRTILAYLPSGIAVRMLDQGKDQTFNKGVQDRAKMGWTKVMVTVGDHEGKMGWVSNSFLRAKL